MVIASCPPDVTNPVYEFSDGARLTIDQLGPLMATVKSSGRKLFGDMINQQTAWLGVPAVNTVGSGHVMTNVPRGTATLLALLPSAPWLARYLPLANQMRMSCEMIQGCKIVGADGAVLTEMRQAQGEGFTIATVELADAPPRPSGAQPPSLVPPFAYLSSDVVLPRLVEPDYRRGARQAWGAHMAPSASRGGRWATAIGAGLVAGLVVALLAHQRRRNDVESRRMA
jgi:hypothetical protein